MKMNALLIKKTPIHLPNSTSTLFSVSEHYVIMNAPCVGMCVKSTIHDTFQTTHQITQLALQGLSCLAETGALGMLSAWGLHFYTLSLANFGFFQNFSTWVHLPQTTTGSIYWIFRYLLGTAVSPTSTLSSTLTPDREYIIHSRCSIKTCLPLSSTSVHLTLMSTLRRRY